MPGGGRRLRRWRRRRRRSRHRWPRGGGCGGAGRAPLLVGSPGHRALLLALPHRLPLARLRDRGENPADAAPCPTGQPAGCVRAAVPAAPALPGDPGRLSRCPAVWRGAPRGPRRAAGLRRDAALGVRSARGGPGNFPVPPGRACKLSARPSRAAAGRSSPAPGAAAGAAGPGRIVPPGRCPHTKVAGVRTPHGAQGGSPVPKMVAARGGPGPVTPHLLRGYRWLLLGGFPSPFSCARVGSFCCGWGSPPGQCRRGVGGAEGPAGRFCRIPARPEGSAGHRAARCAAQRSRRGIGDVCTTAPVPHEGNALGFRTFVPVFPNNFFVSFVCVLGLFFCFGLFVVLFFFFLYLVLILILMCAANVP